jgi:4-hydroxythreonine-4-phosphate dehydrogenase
MGNSQMLRQERKLGNMMIAISLGEPAGIGPDILLLAAQEARTTPWLVFGSVDVLQARATALGLCIHLIPYQKEHTPSTQAGCMTIVDCPCAATVQAGVLQSLNSVSVLQALTAAAHFCMDKAYCALVTLPIHKGIINRANIPFTGHTEWLADLSGLSKVVMMLGSDSLKVALQTIHIPLSQVPSHITVHELESSLSIIKQHWHSYYQKNPRLLVLGVNPHAGENGYIGREEIDVLIPTILKLNSQGYDLIGPVAADTAFTARQLANIDVVLAMYHDQGLAPLKALAFGEIVNYTLGLPYIRTSVDHGVGLDIAATGQAKDSSFKVALQAAERLLTKGESL